MRHFRVCGFLANGRQFNVTGGTVVQSGGYTYHTFTNSGSLVIGPKSLPTTLPIEYQIFGGGQGGGNFTTTGTLGNPDFASNVGGGGGGGAYITGSANLNRGSYTITVGAGGAANLDGSASGISGVVSTSGRGGGRGGSAGTQVGYGNEYVSAGQTGENGSFAGGTGWRRYTGQGWFAGESTIGGGGGGRGSAGGNAVKIYRGGDGGSGISTWRNGTIAGGGGGTGHTDGNVGIRPGIGQHGGGNGGETIFNFSANGTSGAANTAGGGGSGGAGSNGGSGLVVIRYVTP
jgi:hypothetical protein